MERTARTPHRAEILGMKKKAKKTRKLVNESGQPVDIALIDGYHFGDRVLEGVKFEVRLVKGKPKVAVSKKDKEYIKDYCPMALVWAQDFVEDQLLLDCPLIDPKTDEDVYVVEE